MEQNPQSSKTITQSKLTLRGLIMKIAILLCIVVWQETNGATFVNGMYYVLNSSNNTASLASATGQYGNFGGYAGDVVIPSSVVYQDATYTVTAIQERCFYNCKDITSLTIPASVTKISGTEVFFGCTGIKSIVLEDGDSPITIPGCVYSTQYGNTKATFHYAKLEDIYVGRSIKMSSSSDSDSPFYGQTLLSRVVIGPKVTELPRGFIYGSAISSISLPEGITKIGNYALAYLPNLGEVIFPNSLEEIGWGCCSGSSIERAFVGDNVKILEGTFHSCPNLKSVYLGSGITTLGTNTFAWSNNLSKIYLFSDNLATLNSPGFPDGLGQIFVTNPDRYKNLFPDKYLDKLIVFNNTINTYSGTLPILNYQNYVENTSVVYSIPNGYLNVGTYNINIPVSFQYKNWSSQTSVAVSYVIDPAQLTVVPQNVSRQYGIANPELTCSYFGFKNNETLSVLTKFPAVETTATIDSPVGTYPIIPSGAEAQNYTFNYERGTLTITKADQTIEWEQQFGTVNVGDVIELTATSSAGLPIKYTSTDETIAEIFTQGGKKFVKFLKPGTVSIRANQEGNENYNEADRICKIIQVGSLISSITLNETSVTLNEGESLQLTTNITPSTASNKSIAWESSNTEIATVDSNGKVTAIKQGSTTITVKSTDGSNVSASCNVTVTKPVSNIVLSETEITLNEGQSAKLTATVSPELANNKAIAWSSSNDNVAIVDQNGKVTAIAKGSAIITAKTTDGSNISATCTVNVVKPVSRIVLNETEITLNEGQSAKLTATITPENANNKTIAWSSSNDNVAIVDQNGKVTAISKGSAIITAKATDGSNISASCIVNVVKPISSIVLNETEITLNEGQSTKLTATVSPENANNKPIAWSSSNDNVAIVDQNGKVTAISKGSTIITAKATDGSNISASCIVNVVKPVSSIVLSETEITLNEGQSAKLTATVSPENANNKTIAWSSSNNNVATVDQDGKVTAISKGTAVITARATDGSNISASCTVKVIKLVSSIVLSETEMTLNEGQSAKLTATVSPELANNKTIAWSSSNENVATVDQNGKVTAISKGTAVITARSTDGSNISASCIVNVIKLVSGIVLSETEITLNEGATAQLNAIVSDANNTNIIWFSSNETIATVNQDGKVTAIAKGTAIITAKATDGSNISASCTVNVIKLVSNITLSATNITLNEDESVTLTATISPSTANNKTIAWTSSNESIASVDENGIITAHIQGNAIITATSTDGSNKTASCAVTVIKPVSSIYISHKKISMTIGEKTTLIAYALPLDATNTTLNWYSTDESVVKVEDGVIYAIGSGSAFIIVESTDGSNIMEKCEIIVTKQSGIDVTSSDEVSVYVSNGQIIIDNVPFDHIAYVFHTNGTLMKKETSIGNTIIVQPETNGIYIVLIDSRSYKVLIR